MLKTSQLKFSYDKQNAFSFPDFECQDGESWLLLGNSGSGKTTLLHLLAGMLRPTSGTIEVNGTAINKLSGGALDAFRGNNIGVVFQKPHFIQSLTVGENIGLAQKLAGKSFDKKSIQELLDRLNIGKKFNKKPNKLSEGEKQRASIARAIINQPALILADEPTSALDDANTSQVTQLLEEQATAVNAALLIVTHDNRLKNHISKQISI